MFGRRGMRRGGGRLQRRLGRRRNPLRLGAIRRLAHAHRLLGDGLPAEAAPLFAELAQEAEGFQMPARAAQLHLQAARAFSQSGAGPALLDHARRAVTLLAAAGEAGLLGAALPRFIQELRAQGHATEADQVQQAVHAASGGTPPAPAAPPQPPARLPAMCSQCGGPVRSDEVEWIDDGSAECCYCGSTLLTQ